MTTTLNRLKHEASPYLQQHANNPVDWWPWCEQAFEQAQESNRLILLSVGYSACHWCHVMAHESFEDQATADIMNRLFINIKVDREERPDIDKIYQSAHQILNQRPGGWPLTAILTPYDQRPFFLGTYFPPEEKHDLPAFKEILVRVADFYDANKEKIDEQNQSLIDAMTSMTQAQVNPETSTPGKFSSALLDLARKQLEQHFDHQYAGFDSAPKFPHPTNLERLLRHWNHSILVTEKEDEQARQMLMLTLHAFAAGGIYDQLGGGFFRYSVDEQWMIPHFEKMLYDNGPLLNLFAETAIATNTSTFKRVAIETADWILRDMQSPDGAYYSTLDADSEGHEGLFYIWDRKIVKELLSPDEYQLASEYYALNDDANFEGQWHLYISNNIQQLAEQFSDSEKKIEQHLHDIKAKLFEARQQRIHPGRDEKVLCAWNALAIKGMASAGRRLQQPRYIESAQRAIDFIRTNMYDKGHLYACYKDGKAYNSGMLDDYAFLIDALIELLQSKWRNSDFEFALELADCLLDDFEDTENGGFYFTSNHHESLFHRPKPLSDEAIPAGNAIAAYTLYRLYYMTGNNAYEQAVARTLDFSSESVKQMPYAFCAMLHALEEHLYPPELIVIRGEEKDTGVWHTTVNNTYRANRLSFFIPVDVHLSNTVLSEKKPEDGQCVAYICDGLACRAPIMDHQSFANALNISTKK